MKKINPARCLMFALSVFALSAHATFAAGSSLIPTGPKTVAVGQAFSVTMSVQNAADADTIRLNGTFSPDLLRWVSASPRGGSLNVSPGASLDQSRGVFSYGVFSLGKTLSGDTPVAVMTFMALKPGTATIQLSPTSRVLSAGADQLVGQGSLSIQIIPRSAAQAAAEAQVGLMSATHPDGTAWYASRDVTISWSMATLSGYRVTVGYDQAPQGPAEHVVTDGTWSFSVPSDGVWYAHLKAVSPSGAILTNDFRVQIDRTPPRKIVPVTEQDNVPSTFPNSLIFAAIDDTSGIGYYDISIDGAFVASTTANQWAMPTLSAGQHAFEVVAYDRAGNATSGSGRVTVATPAENVVSVAIIKTFIVYIVGGILAAVLAAIVFWFYWGAGSRKKVIHK